FVQGHLSLRITPQTRPPARPPNGRLGSGDLHPISLTPVPACHLHTGRSGGLSSPILCLVDRASDLRVRVKVGHLEVFFIELIAHRTVECRQLPHGPQIVLLCTSAEPAKMRIARHPHTQASAATPCSQRATAIIRPGT